MRPCTQKLNDHLRILPSRWWVSALSFSALSTLAPKLRRESFGRWSPVLRLRFPSFSCLLASQVASFNLAHYSIHLSLSLSISLWNTHTSEYAAAASTPFTHADEKCEKIISSPFATTQWIEEAALGVSISSFLVCAVTFHALFLFHHSFSWKGTTSSADMANAGVVELTTHSIRSAIWHKCVSYSQFPYWRPRRARARVCCGQGSRLYPRRIVKM